MQSMITCLARENQWPDSMLFAMLFCDEKARLSLVKEYADRLGYSQGGNPIYTVISVLTGSQDGDIWGDSDSASVLRSTILQNWLSHVTMLLLTLPQV